MFLFHFVCLRAFKTVKMDINKLHKDVKMENQNIIQTIAVILSNIENHLAVISKTIDELGCQKEKRSKKEKESIEISGGIIAQNQSEVKQVCQISIQMN